LTKTDLQRAATGGAPFGASAYPLQLGEADERGFVADRTERSKFVREEVAPE